MTWLSSNSVLYAALQTPTELFQLVEVCKSQDKVYVLDDIVISHSHRVV
jgi:hypothetical protein